MMFRIIGYFMFFVILVFFDLLLIGKKPHTFSVVWKKTLLYCISFVIYIIWCYIFDFALQMFEL